MQKVILSAVLFLLLVVASCKFVDKDSDSNVVDPTEYTLDLTQPNGNEVIAEGGSYTIKWTSNTTQRVYIAFTFDNGSSWFMVADSIENTGTFDWFPVPNRVSDQCKIKVATVDGAISSESAASFSIVKNSNQSIVITDPNGGEEIEAGSAYAIKWFSSGIDSIRLEFTPDNGQHWNLIAVDTFNTGIYYWEPVPNTPSTLSRIRIKDALDGAPSDQSDSIFTILPEPKIEVLKPAGGETWTVGSSQRIEWYSENIEKVNIDFTTNNGFSWTNIKRNIESIGYATWDTIPAINSQQCKIRIADSKDGQPWAVSENTFIITNPVNVEAISVVSPNGGEEYEAGTLQNISWNSNGIDSVKIELSTNDGRSWAVLISPLENTGGYQWQINRELNAPQSRIRISDFRDGIPSDVSDASFTIKPIKSINVTFPTSGLVFSAGAPIRIEWESSGIEKVGIRYTYTNGQPTLDYSGFEVLETAVANEGFYETSFSIPSEQYYVEVFEAEEGSPKSRSDGNFKITEQIFPNIILKQPNGGEEFLTSDPLNTYSHEILWESSEIENVRLEYSLNGGATWNTIVNNIPSSGIYTWVMPQNIAFRSENALVRVVSTADSTYYDVSDAVFAIHPQDKLIRVIYPNGGEDETEVLEPEKPEDPVPAMTWHSAGVYRVKIELSLDNGMTWELIEADYQSTGAYGFPFIFAPSTNARIKITDVSADAGPVPMSDISDYTFFYRIKKN